MKGKKKRIIIKGGEKEAKALTQHFLEN